MRPPRKPFIIAEAGVNHNGSLARAAALVDAAVEAGADAVKFQTFRANRLATPKARKVRYQEEACGRRGSQLDMLRRLELDAAAHRTLFGRCRRKGILFLSTPFDEESADLLYSLGMRMFKIPSGEITNLPFLAHIGRKRRPVILSTGMSTLGEIAAAVRVLRRAGASRTTLLHCVSSYPTSPRDANLRAMRTLADRFGLPVGYSDHTEGIAVAVAAAALGADVLEKHFTLDKSLPGPDHRMSLDPAELKSMVTGAREAFLALGDGVKGPRPCERGVRLMVRKSLVLARDLPAGTRLKAGMLTCKRPGTGIPPSRLGDVEGRTLRRKVARDTILRWGMLR